MRRVGGHAHVAARSLVSVVALLGACASSCATLDGGLRPTVADCESVRPSNPQPAWLDVDAFPKVDDTAVRAEIARVAWLGPTVLAMVPAVTVFPSR